MDFKMVTKLEDKEKFNNHRKSKKLRAPFNFHLIIKLRKSRLLELEIETLKEQNYMLTEKLSHLINMTIGSFHILDGTVNTSAKVFGRYWR